MLKLVYYAGIMLDALACLLCVKLCWHNRPRPTAGADSEFLKGSSGSLKQTAGGAAPQNI